MHTGRLSRWIFVPFVAIFLSVPPLFAQGQKGEKPKEDGSDKARPIDPAAPVVMLDDFEADLKWTNPAWTDRADLSLVQHAGSNALRIACGPGQYGKAAIQRFCSADLSSRDKLVLDAFNPGDKAVPMSVAFFVSQGGNFFESSWAFIKKGENKDVTIDLKAPTFKSETSKWAHSAKAPLEHVRAIVLMFYPKVDGELYIDNVRLVRNP